MTGLTFFSEHDADSYRDPFAPSLDRIEPKKGYVDGNVRIVVWAINAMLCDWGEDVFYCVANAYRAQRTKIGQSIPNFSGDLPTQLLNC